MLAKRPGYVRFDSMVPSSVCGVLQRLTFRGIRFNPPHTNIAVRLLMGELRNKNERVALDERKPMIPNIRV